MNLKPLVDFTLKLLNDIRGFAVVNNYVDPNLSAVPPKLTNNVSSPGGITKTAMVSFVIGANDQQLSVYRLFKSLSPDIVIKSLRLYNDAVTGGTSFSIGLATPLDYDNVGAFIGTNVEICASIDLSSAHPVTSAPAVADTAITIPNRAVPLWQLAGQQQYPAKSPSFDICLKALAMTTGGGGANICAILDYVQL